jgi:hypothetical protein
VNREARLAHDGPGIVIGRYPANSQVVMLIIDDQLAVKHRQPSNVFTMKRHHIWL